MTAVASTSGQRWRVRDVVLLAPKIVLTGLLVLAIGDMVVGVFLRYVVVAITDRLDLDPINFFWVEEVGEYSLAWLTMIGAGIGIAERAHFTLHIVTHRLPLNRPAGDPCGNPCADRRVLGRSPSGTAFSWRS